jgi:cyclic pyranopterin phosphate synthase
MPEENFPCHAGEELMTAAEIEQLTAEFVKLGIQKVRLTGGEPLMRKDFAEVLSRLAKLPIDLHITTNAVLVDKYIEDLKKANVKTVNVSIDSLKESTFFEITKRNQFQRVWKNILLLLDQKFDVKLNVVALKGVIENEFFDFIELTKNMRVEVRFIEFMPFSGNGWDSSKVVTANQMLEWAQQSVSLMKIEDLPHATTKKYRIEGHLGSIAFITTMTNHFCGDCNRLRLTAEGKMKNCLFGREETDLLTALRKSEPIEPLIRNSVFRKFQTLGGQLVSDFKKIDANAIENRSMIEIGG